MPRGLVRYQESGQSHFVTFSCYQRRPNFVNGAAYDLFLTCLEDMRRHFAMRIYGYVLMPEHVHLLLSEPEAGATEPALIVAKGSPLCSTNPATKLADAIHYLKLSFTKRLHNRSQVSVQKPDANLGHGFRDTNLVHRPHGSFWQQRYYDRNVRDAREFSIKLRYMHQNPVKRGLVQEPQEWKWSSFRHYYFREMGVVEIESEWTARDRELKLTEGTARIFLRPG